MENVESQIAEWRAYVANARASTATKSTSWRIIFVTRSPS